MLKEYKKIIPVILLLFICTAVNGQTLTMLNGAVFEKGSNKRVINANVYNVRTARTVNTDKLGLFTMPSSEGDTLQITHPDYLSKEFIVLGFSDVIIHLQSLNAKQKITFRANKKLNRQTDAEADDKEINFRFNDMVIKNNTNLKPEEIKVFKKNYKPKIEELKNWSDYDLYNYIKKSLIEFQKKITQ